ncbi:MAG: hypothetical protein WDO70_02880 [Alphaproteobacteria bacterium]
MGLHAYKLYQGSDWQTHRQSVAQVHDTLDRLREAIAMCLSGPVRPHRLFSFDPPSVLLDLCGDLSGEVDFALADLAPHLQQHLPSRWLMVELRAIIAQLPGLARHAFADHDLIPELGDRAERARHLLQRIDS